MRLFQLSPKSVGFCPLPRTFLELRIAEVQSSNAVTFHVESCHGAELRAALHSSPGPRPSSWPRPHSARSDPLELAEALLPQRWGENTEVLLVSQRATAARQAVTHRKSLHTSGPVVAQGAAAAGVAATQTLQPCTHTTATAVPNPA